MTYFWAISPLFPLSGPMSPICFPIVVLGPISGPICFPILGRKPETYFLVGRLVRMLSDNIKYYYAQLSVKTQERQKHIKHKETPLGSPVEDPTLKICMCLEDRNLLKLRSLDSSSPLFLSDIVFGDNGHKCSKCYDRKAKIACKTSKNAIFATVGKQRVDVKCYYRLGKTA